MPRRFERAFGGTAWTCVAACAVFVGLIGLTLGALALGVIFEPGATSEALLPGLVLFAGAMILLVLLAVRASLQHGRRADGAEQTGAALRETIDALPAGVLLFDKDERLVHYNQAALQSSPALRYGATVGMTYKEIVERSYTRAAELGAPLANTPAEWIARFRSKGGSATRQAIGKRWFEWTERATPSGGTVALRTDITDLIQREQDAERARKLLQATLDALPAGVTLYDSDERMVIYNKAAAAMNPALNWPTAVGRTFGELSYELLVAAGLSAEEAESEAVKWVERFRSGGRAEIFQLGDGRWVSVSEHPAEGGGTVGLRLDVSELKAREQELESSRNVLQATLDALPAGITLYDREERMVAANKAAISINPDLAARGAIGTTFPELSRRLRIAAGHSGEVLEDGVRRAIARFRGDGSRDVFRIADGRWIEASEHAVEGVGTVGLRLDVSELRAREQEILRARDQLQETLDALPAGVELYNSEERLTVVNRAAIDISCGLLTSASIGRTFTELAHMAEARQTANTHDPQTAEARIARFRTKGQRHVRRTPDGRWVERFEQATPSGGTIGLRVDVSALKNRELEIERTRALLQETIDALPAGVTLWDRDERLVMFNEVAAGINPRVRTQIGHTFSEVVGELVEVMEKAGLAVPSDWLSAFRAKTQRRIMRAPDGRWIEWSERLTTSGHTVGLRVDVSELKQREQELERSRAEYRSIVESSGASMLLVDRNLDIVMANQEFWKSSGFTPEDTIGRPFLEKIDSAFDPLVLKSWLSGPLGEEQARPVQYTKRRRDAAGRERVLAITATPIVDSERMLEQIVFLTVDDTERRDAEQLLVDTERLATVGEMASTVAHEIAQPLQVINIAGASARSEIEQAVDDSKPADLEFLAARLARIAEQVERADQIVGQLRAFVRGSASDVATRFDPGKAIKGAIDLTSHGADLAGTQMTATIDGPLPPVSGHLTRLEQVLVNLINNARDAGAKGIVVAASGVLREGRDMVRIAVDDTGPGIPPDILPRLFESFVTTKPRGKGTGLGLRICRRIVEEMGGTISAANRPEGGARFEILLPPALH